MLGGGANREHRVQMGHQQQLSGRFPLGQHSGRQMGAQTRFIDFFHLGSQFLQNRAQQLDHLPVSRLMAAAAVQRAELLQQSQNAGQRPLRPL